MSKLAEKLKSLPQKPGVYLYKNSEGEVLYVGKAKNLKNRVKSYFAKNDHEPRIVIMLEKARDVDWVIVSSDLEALILENNLIKKYRPPFNVMMRDDKDYQFIKIDYGFEIPQIYSVRKIEDSGAKSKYFGPYTSGLSVRQTLKFIHEIFHLCRNKKISDKPCFAFHLNRCPGVCIRKVSLAEYKKTFKQIEEFLGHRRASVLETLKTEMHNAASGRRFEVAARARDKIRALEHTWEKQKIVSARKDNQDFLGLYRLSDKAILCDFIVRGGKLIHVECFELSHQDSSPEEIIERFIMDYFAVASDIPKEVYLPIPLPNQHLLEIALKRLRNIHVSLRIPRIGKKKQLLELAEENATDFHEREIASFQKQPQVILENLKKILALTKIPRRIEGFDISNIQGTNPVGSMIVFTDGAPDKSQYRKFKINIKNTPDDFAMMREMLERRFKHASSSLRGSSSDRNNLTNEIAMHPSDARRLSSIRGDLEGSRDGRNDATLWPLPDLVVIDGGKGQLNVAVKVLKNYDLKIPVVGLAKRLEEIFIPRQKHSIILPNENPVLFLLQRIRDESHRFAITFYRSRHAKELQRSAISEIPGIGPATRKKLLQKFGSVTAIRNASLEVLASEVGPALAKKIKENL